MRDILLTNADGTFTKTQIQLAKTDSVIGPKFLFANGKLYQNTGMGKSIFYREVPDFKVL